MQKSTNFTLYLKNFVVSGSCLHEFETCYGCVFKKWIYFVNQNNGEMTKRYQKSYFYDLFLGWKYEKYEIWKQVQSYGTVL